MNYKAGFQALALFVGAVFLLARLLKFPGEWSKENDLTDDELLAMWRKGELVPLCCVDQREVADSESEG